MNALGDAPGDRPVMDAFSYEPGDGPAGTLPVASPSSAGTRA